MEIKIQLFGRVFSLCIGYYTKWFSQVDYITLTEEFPDEDYSINYANLIWTFWRGRGFKNGS